jgi:multidrug resistance efflux pump
MTLLDDTTKKINPSAESDFPSLQLVRTNRWVRRFGKVTFFVLLISLVAMIFAPWQQSASGTGMVVALDPQERPQPVKSPIKGVVQFVQPDLREGSFVEKGEVLIRLAPTAEAGVSQLDSQLSNVESQKASAQGILALTEQSIQLQARIGESLVRSLDSDLLAAEQKWEQTKQEVEALQAELSDKQNLYNVAKSLLPDGLVSAQEEFSKRTAMEAAESKVRKAESAVDEALNAFNSKREEIDGKKRDLLLKNQSAQQKYQEAMQKVESMDKELSQLQTKRDEYDRLEITATRSGFIQQWYGLEGSDTVKAGDQLFVLVPEATELAIEMKVTGNDMPLISEGDHVRLQFEGWPAVQFVGWPSVAFGTFGGKVNRVFPTDDSKGNFRVIITEDQKFDTEKEWPTGRYLRQGVRANGWVLLKQVPLGYEIWRQLNGFPPVVAEDEPNKPKDKVLDKKPKLPKM